LGGAAAGVSRHHGVKRFSPTRRSSVKHVPADPKAPVQIQIGGRPAALNPTRDDD